MERVDGFDTAHTGHLGTSSTTRRSDCGSGAEMALVTAGEMVVAGGWMGKFVCAVGGGCVGGFGWGRRCADVVVADVVVVLFCYPGVFGPFLASFAISTTTSTFQWFARRGEVARLDGRWLSSVEFGDVGLFLACWVESYWSVLFWV